MNCITLDSIIKTGTEIEYRFTVSEGLNKYFSGKPFFISYPEDITDVPDAIAAIPFVCNVLPIIWLTNSKLIVPELDEAFWECIANVKQGYATMFPESSFAGELVAKTTVPCDRPSNGGCAAFFSGGLDATQTLVSHFNEKPHLISIWGSDIRYDNPEGWAAVHNGITETCKNFNLPDVVIKSSFRDFDNEGTLDRDFREQLKDGWWHGVKHGIGLLGHAAPYVYLKRLSTVYIASSNCPSDGIVRCASNPSIDNYVRYADCKVVHDGFEFSRQDKTHNIVKFVQQTGNDISLHVCWESTNGNNCCYCEKCYRTISGILAEGDEPQKYGFYDAKATMVDMKSFITIRCREMQTLPDYWPHIHNRIRQNKKKLRKKPYWKHIRWIAKTDFKNLKEKKLPIIIRIRSQLANYKFYQALHKLKEML